MIGRGRTADLKKEAAEDNRKDEGVYEPMKLFTYDSFQRSYHSYARMCHRFQI